MNLITNASDALGGRPGTIAVSTGAVEADEAYLSSMASFAPAMPSSGASRSMSEIGTRGGTADRM